VTQDQYNRWKKEERLRYLEASIKWLRDEAVTLCQGLERAKTESEGLRTLVKETREENAFLKDLTKATKRHNLLLKRTVEKLKEPETLKRYGDAFM
jgi:hypothetical protein